MRLGVRVLAWGGGLIAAKVIPPVLVTVSITPVRSVTSHGLDTGLLPDAPAAPDSRRLPKYPPGGCQELPPGLPYGSRDPSTWASPYCFPGYDSGELGQKWCSQAGISTHTECQFLKTI